MFSVLFKSMNYGQDIINRGEYQRSKIQRDNTPRHTDLTTILNYLTCNCSRPQTQAKEVCRSLEKLVHNSLVCWPSLLLLTESMDNLPVNLTATVLEIHLGKLYWTLALPDPSDNPEDKNNGNGEPCLEELVGGCELTSITWRSNGREQLGCVR